MQSDWEPIRKRVSCRAYQDRPLEPALIASLQNKIQELNEASGLHFQLIVSDTPGKPAVKLLAAMFSGSPNVCAALVGGEDCISGEKVGYYGEKLVLYATSLGLGTCWVAGTFDRKSVRPDIAPGEKLWDVVPIGYALETVPARQKMIRKSIRSRDRKPEEFLESDLPLAQLPMWVQKGVEAVRLGPSAVNQQPVNIRFRNGTISARIWKKGHGLEYNDLGIAKCQFEAGAYAYGVTGHWDFGDGGVFHISKVVSGGED